MPWALVTGAARRLGREFALHLAAQGWDIHLHYHGSHSQARETEDLIRALGREVRLQSFGFEDPAGVSQLLQSVQSSPPTLLVNAASGWAEDRWDSLEDPALEAALRVTATAPFRLARGVAALAPQGLVVNILDARMEDYDKNHLAYHLAKRTLAALTRVAALELAPGWRVNGMAPGLILKPDTLPESTWEALKSSTPLACLGTSQDLIRTLDYYIESPFVTGQVIFVDGGRFLKGGFYGF